MNKIYILMGDGGYDGDSVLGVYTSAAEAGAAARVYDAKVEADKASKEYELSDYEGYFVLEKNIGAEAKYEGSYDGVITEVVI